MNGSGASKSFRGTLSEAEAIKRLQRFLQCLLARQMLKNRRLRRQLRQCWNLGKLFQAYSEAGVNHDRAMAAFLLQRPGSPDSPTKHRMGSEALARRQIDSILASEARVGEYESSRMPSDAQVLQVARLQLLLSSYSRMRDLVQSYKENWQLFRGLGDSTRSGIHSAARNQARRWRVLRAAIADNIASIADASGRKGHLVSLQAVTDQFVQGAQPGNQRFIKRSVAVTRGRRFSMHGDIRRTTVDIPIASAAQAGSSHDGDDDDDDDGGGLIKGRRNVRQGPVVVRRPQGRRASQPLVSIKEGKSSSPMPIENAPHLEIPRYHMDLEEGHEALPTAKLTLGQTLLFLRDARVLDVTLAHRQLISLFEAAVTHQEYLKERRQRLQGTSSKSYGRRMSKSSSRTDEDALSSSSRSIPKSMEPAGNSHGIPEAAKQPAKPDVPLWRKSLNYEGFQFLLHRLADNYCLLAYGATPLPESAWITRIPASLDRVRSVVGSLVRKEVIIPPEERMALFLERIVLRFSQRRYESLGGLSGWDDKTMSRRRKDTIGSEGNGSPLRRGVKAKTQTHSNGLPSGSKGVPKHLRGQVLTEWLNTELSMRDRSVLLKLRKRAPSVVWGDDSDYRNVLSDSGVVWLLARFEPFLGSLFDRYASRAYTACRTLPYHWWELDHLNPDGVAALRSDTIDERRRPIKLRYFPPPKRLSYLDFLKVLYENSLLSTASWSDPETFVTLMSIFLGAFPTPTPLQESSWSRLSGLPPPLPGLEPLSFGEKFLLHRVRTLRPDIVEFFQRSKMMRTVFLRSEGVGHRDASPLRRPSSPGSPSHSKATDTVDVEVVGVITCAKVYDCLRDLHLPISDTEVRLALRLRGLTKGDQVSMDTFLELAEDLLILRFRLSTVALTEWQFTHCIAMAAVHGLLNSVRIEQWKRTQALWNMARNRVRGIVSMMKPMIQRRRLVDVLRPHMLLSLHVMVSFVLERMTLVANPDGLSVQGPIIPLPAFMAFVSTTSIFVSLNTADAIAAVKRVLRRNGHRWTALGTSVKALRRVQLPFHLASAVFIELLEMEFRSEADTTRYTDPMVEPSANLKLPPVKIPAVVASATASVEEAFPVTAWPQVVQRLFRAVWPNTVEPPVKGLNHSPLFMSADSRSPQHSAFFRSSRRELRTPSSSTTSRGAGSASQGGPVTPERPPRLLTSGSGSMSHERSSKSTESAFLSQVPLDNHMADAPDIEARLKTAPLERLREVSGLLHLRQLLLRYSGLATANGSGLLQSGKESPSRRRQNAAAAAAATKRLQAAAEDAEYHRGFAPPLRTYMNIATQDPHCLLDPARATDLRTAHLIVALNALFCSVDLRRLNRMMDKEKSDALLRAGGVKPSRNTPGGPARSDRSQNLRSYDSSRRSSTIVPDVPVLGFGTGSSLRSVGDGVTSHRTNQIEEVEALFGCPEGQVQILSELAIRCIDVSMCYILDVTRQVVGSLSQGSPTHFNHTIMENESPASDSSPSPPSKGAQISPQRPRLGNTDAAAFGMSSRTLSSLMALETTAKEGLRPRPPPATRGGTSLWSSQARTMKAKQSFRTRNILSKASKGVSSDAKKVTSSLLEPRFLKTMRAAAEAAKAEKEGGNSSSPRRSSREQQSSSSTSSTRISLNHLDMDRSWTRVHEDIDASALETHVRPGKGLSPEGVLLRIAFVKLWRTFIARPADYEGHAAVQTVWQHFPSTYLIPAQQAQLGESYGTKDLKWGLEQFSHSDDDTLSTSSSASSSSSKSKEKPVPEPSSSSRRKGRKLQRDMSFMTGRNLHNAINDVTSALVRVSSRHQHAVPTPTTPRTPAKPLEPPSPRTASARRTIQSMWSGAIAKAKSAKDIQEEEAEGAEEGPLSRKAADKLTKPLNPAFWVWQADDSLAPKPKLIHRLSDKQAGATKPAVPKLNLKGISNIPSSGLLASSFRSSAAPSASARAVNSQPQKPAYLRTVDSRVQELLSPRPPPPRGAEPTAEATAVNPKAAYASSAGEKYHEQPLIRRLLERTEERQAYAASARERAKKERRTSPKKAKRKSKAETARARPPSRSSDGRSEFPMLFQSTAPKGPVGPNTTSGIVPTSSTADALYHGRAAFFPESRATAFNTFITQRFTEQQQALSTSPSGSPRSQPRELPEYIATARSVLGDNVFVETMAAMAMGVGIGVDHPLTKPRAEAKPKAREGEMDLKALWGQLSGGRAKSGGTIATPTTTTSTGAGANRVKSTPSSVTVPMGNATDAKGRPGVPPAAASTATPTPANEEEEKEKEEKEEEEEVERGTASATTAAPAVPKKLKKVQSLTPLAIPTPATPAAMTEGTTGTAPSPGASDQSFISDTPTTPSQTSSTATPSHHQPSNYFFVSPIAPPPPSREAVAALEEFSESTRQRMESFGFPALDSNEDGPSPFR